MTSRQTDAAEFELQMRIAREIMDRDRDALRYLAGHEDAIPAEEIEKARTDLRRFLTERRASGHGDSARASDREGGQA